MAQCMNGNAKTTQKGEECMAEQSLHTSSSAKMYLCRRLLSVSLPCFCSFWHYLSFFRQSTIYTIELTSRVS